MEKQIHTRSRITGTSGAPQGNFHYQKAGNFIVYKETEKDLNSKILKTRMMIHDEFPELSKHLEEMPLTVTDISNQEDRMKKLRAYYESLSSLFIQHKLEQYYK